MLHPLIKVQVSSQLESPKTKSELIQLILIVKFTLNFCPPSISNITVWENQMLFCDVGKTNQSTKLKKHGKNNYDKSGFSITKLCKDKPIVK